MIPSAWTDRVLMSEHEYYDHSSDLSASLGLSLYQIPLVVTAVFILAAAVKLGFRIWNRNAKAVSKGESMV